MADSARLPWVSGEPLHERAAPDGALEQHVFKAWVVEVFDLWESRYRTKLERQFRDQFPDACGLIRPEQEVLGDLRHIRNNLVHGGVAKRGEAASCKILRWFEEGDRMRVQVRHVLDFLNQMGWLTDDCNAMIEESNRVRASGWRIHTDRDPAPGLPTLVSIRPLILPEAEDPKYRYGVSVAFEDGVFGLPMGPADGIVSEPYRRWEEMYIDGEGNLGIPGAARVFAMDLYETCGAEPKTSGPGVWSRWVRFRR